MFSAARSHLLDNTLLRISFARGRSMPFPYEPLSDGEALGKLRISPGTAGPAACLRAEEDRAATRGNTLSVHACLAAGFGDSMLGNWFRGIKLGFRSVCPVAVFQGDPSVRERPEVAAAGLDWLASLGRSTGTNRMAPHQIWGRVLHSWSRRGMITELCAIGPISSIV